MFRHLVPVEMDNCPSCGHEATEKRKHNVDHKLMISGQKGTIFLLLGKIWVPVMN